MLRVKAKVQLRRRKPDDLKIATFWLVTKQSLESNYRCRDIFVTEFTVRIGTNQRHVCLKTQIHSLSFDRTHNHRQHDLRWHGFE